MYVMVIIQSVGITGHELNGAVVDWMMLQADTLEVRECVLDF